MIYLGFKIIVYIWVLQLMHTVTINSVSCSYMYKYK